MNRWKPIIQSYLLVSVCIGCLPFGCGGRTMLVFDGASTADSSVATDSTAIVKDGSASDLTVQVDINTVDQMKTSDGPHCFCDKTEAILVGNCVPTTMLQTCGKRCDPIQKTCGPLGTDRCDPKAGTPSCVTSSLIPACVPQGKLYSSPGVLRIHPVTGPAGKTQEIRITGAELHIGALWWDVRWSTKEKPKMIPDNSGQGDRCLRKVSIPFNNPGIYPIEVSYGGAPWFLAGFYTASSGVISSGVQPGYPCNTGNTCISGGGYNCSCVSGRCQCK